MGMSGGQRRPRPHHDERDQRHADGGRDAGAAHHLHGDRPAHPAGREGEPARDQGRAGRGHEKEAGRLHRRAASASSSARPRCRSAELEEKLKANAKAQTDKEIYLHADRDLPYGIVVEVMAAAQRAGRHQRGDDHGPDGGRQASKDKDKKQRNPDPWPSHAHSLLATRPSPLAPFLALSVAGARRGGAVAGGGGWLFAGPKVIDLDQTPITASLVRLGKPRDEKLLPRKEEAVRLPPRQGGGGGRCRSRSAGHGGRDPGRPRTPSRRTPRRRTAPRTQEEPVRRLQQERQAGQARGAEGQADGDPNGDSAKQEGERYFGAAHRRGEAELRRVRTPSPRRSAGACKAEVALRIGRGGRGCSRSPSPRPRATSCSTRQCSGR